MYPLAYGLRVLLVRLVELAEGGAGAVEDLVPAVFVTPLLQAGGVDGADLVVVEGVAHIMLIEPGAGLFHGVAGLDAVQHDAHAGCP